MYTCLDLYLVLFKALNCLFAYRVV
jgi:hypothetical protein